MPALRTKRIAIVALLILAGLICASRYTGQPRREHPRDNSFFEETPFDSPDADATQIVLKTPPDFSELLPDIEVDTTRAYEAETRKAIRRVFECMATYGDDCANRPEGHIVIVAYEHFWRTTTGNQGGEIIWCESLLVSFEQLGYSVFTGTSLDMVLFLYRLFPDLVRVIIMQIRFGPEPASNYVGTCFNDKHCIQSASNPTGIPPWKLFGLGFWETGGNPPEFRHPWGTSRVLSPYRFPKHYYIGYAIDHHCTKLPVVLPEKRKKQAFLLAKQASYFHDPLAWPLDAYTEIANKTGMKMLTVANSDPAHNASLPDGLESIGRLTRDKFYEEISSSKVLIGIGRPFLSPSPYDALCLGVPFINPYDKTRLPSMDPVPPGVQIYNPFIIQHGGLAHLKPPYVYHVPRGDVAALVKAVEQADKYPIAGRGLPEEMYMRSLMERVRELVEDTDWEEKAKVEGLMPR